MPFVSEAQRRWMYANDPDMAARWESETPAGPLPARVGEGCIPSIGWWGWGWWGEPQTSWLISVQDEPGGRWRTEARVYGRKSDAQMRGRDFISPPRGAHKVVLYKWDSKRRRYVYGGGLWA